MSEALEHRRLRAPREDGGRAIDPPLTALADVVDANVAAAAAHDYDLQGRSLRALAGEARRQLLAAAYDYTRSYRDVPRPDAGVNPRLFLAGHQPQLFHPGVWFKNFVLSTIAPRHRAVAVNLAIDSDTIKSSSLRVPGGTLEQPTYENLPFDRPTAEIPYEERTIVDPDLLASFGQRAAAAIRHLVPNPLLREFWPLVERRAAECDNLGQCLAQARHQQEGLWGATTLELPQSAVCDLPAFAWFACHLLARLPRLWEQYNLAVADYRAANHVRSSAHPVPDLEAVDDWLEAPFWIWHRDNPRRRRLFVRQRGDEIILSDRLSLEYPLPLTPDGEAHAAVEQWAKMADAGVRIRTRALITTMFARLCLSDLFLHGIGGAKYDQVTDALVERFFGLRPPTYMTLTATLRLPIARETVTTDAARQIDQELRELAYHPERTLETPVDGEANELVRQKRAWIETTATPDNAKARCRAIRAANQGLQPYLADRKQQLSHQRERIAAALRVESVLASREYAFCLYPAGPLRALMQV